MASSALDIQLGLLTLTAVVVLIRTGITPWPILKNISWGVLPPVAGLFVLVLALDKSGLIDALSRPSQGCRRVIDRMGRRYRRSFCHQPYGQLANRTHRQHAVQTANVLR
jgi:hypothetical protein